MRRIAIARSLYATMPYNSKTQATITKLRPAILFSVGFNSGWKYFTQLFLSLTFFVWKFHVQIIFVVNFTRQLSVELLAEKIIRLKFVRRFYISFRLKHEWKFTNKHKIKKEKGLQPVASGSRTIGTAAYNLAIVTTLHEIVFYICIAACSAAQLPVRYKPF